MSHGRVFWALAMALVLAVAPVGAQKPVEKPRLEQAVYGVGELELFVSYARESYRAAFGVEAPVFDPGARPKLWFDTTAPADPEEEVAYRFVIGDRIVVRHMLAGEARAVNIPPGSYSGPALKAQWGVPVRALDALEALVPSPFGLLVRRLDLWARAEEDAAHFTTGDRALLRAIAQKLGVP